MNRFFMIEFKYLGESYFANVFEFGTSQSQYDVQLINLYPSTGTKISLKRTTAGLELVDTTRPLRQEFVNLIISRIEEHLVKSSEL